MAVKDIYFKQLVDSLFKDGMEILRKANRTNKTLIDSNNMRDAYGCGIFYKGKCIKRGYINKNPKSTGIHKGWKKHDIPDNTGRGYLDDFLNNYRPKGGGLSMLCVNAVYYTNILEDGAQGRSKKPPVEVSTQYRIISQSDQAFEALKKNYKDSYVQSLRK